MSRVQAIRTSLLILILVVAFLDARAQKNLFVGLNNSKGYVVGARLQQSGIFRFDGDTSWTHIGWNHPSIFGLAFVDSANSIIHAAAGNGEMRSLDGGASWRITTGWQVTEAQHIAIDRSDRDRLYLATSYGTWRSRDGGDTWRQVSDVYTQAVVSDVFTERRVIAATEEGLQLTVTGGDRWQLVGPTIPMIDVDQSDSHPLEWIAGSRSQGILRSNDGGLTWTNVLPLDSSATGVAIDPSNHNRLVAVTWGDGVKLSQDAGVTWTSPEGLPTPYLVETIFDANGTGRIWVATREEGIFLSDDAGASWEYAGMTGTMVYDMVYAP